MVNRDIVLTKIAHVKESLNRLHQKQGLMLDQFVNDRDSQDIALFNMQTAIQGCIDIASHIVSDNNWGVPATLADLFDALYEHKVISQAVKSKLRLMVGLRNIIVHEYTGLDLTRVYVFLKEGLVDFDLFLKEIASYVKS